MEFPEAFVKGLFGHNSPLLPTITHFPPFMQTIFLNFLIKIIGVLTPRVNAKKPRKRLKDLRGANP